jgi:hypothetical protein
MFDKLFDLPKIASSVSQEVTSKIGEAASKVSSSLATSALNKIASGVPSFTELASSNILGKAVSPVLSELSANLGSAASALGGLGTGLGNLANNPFGLDAAFGDATTSLSASALRETVGEPADSAVDETHKVKLISIVDNNSVYFENMPQIQETRRAEYEALQPPQMPGEFQKYKGTKSVQWTITATLTAATVFEASVNRDYVNLLRTWTYPYFGDAQQGTGRLGAPPPVILFSGWRNLVGEVPTVITDLNWTWPKDVDWIPTDYIDQYSGMPVPFPAVIEVTITLVESFSANQLNSINLIDYRDGNMVGAFAIPANQPENSGELSSSIEPDVESMMAESEAMIAEMSAVPEIDIPNIEALNPLPNLSADEITATIPELDGADSMPTLSDLGDSDFIAPSEFNDPPISNLAADTDDVNVDEVLTEASSGTIEETAEDMSVFAAASASFNLNQSTYFGVASNQLTYTGDDPIVWDNVNTERLRRGLSGLPNTRPV